MCIHTKIIQYGLNIKRNPLKILIKRRSNCIEFLTYTMGEIEIVNWCERKRRPFSGKIRGIIYCSGGWFVTAFVFLENTSARWLTALTNPENYFPEPLSELFRMTLFFILSLIFCLVEIFVEMKFYLYRRTTNTHWHIESRVNIILNPLRVGLRI